MARLGYGCGASRFGGQPPPSSQKSSCHVTCTRAVGAHHDARAERAHVLQVVPGRVDRHRSARERSGHGQQLRAAGAGAQRARGTRGGRAPRRRRGLRGGTGGAHRIAHRRGTGSRPPGERGIRHEQAGEQQRQARVPHGMGISERPGSGSMKSRVQREGEGAAGLLDEAERLAVAEVEEVAHRERGARAAIVMTSSARRRRPERGTGERLARLFAGARVPPAPHWSSARAATARPAARARRPVA